MTLAIDHTGRSFNNCIALSRANKANNGKWRWRFKCFCGNEFVAIPYDMQTKQVSCGCHRNKITIEKNKKSAKHNLTGSRTWLSWFTMRQRCNNPKATGFKYWGGAGVVVCKEWNDFRVFLKDMGERPAGKTLDRINPYGNYEPTNCRWATYKEQVNNQRARQ